MFFFLRGFLFILSNFFGVCGGTNIICSTFTHSHNFFCVSGGSVSVGQCAFLVFGQQQVAL